LVNATLMSISPTAALQLHRDDLPGIRTGERDTRFGRFTTEPGDEEALPHEQRALQAAEQPAVHLGIHLDALGHVHHRARFRANRVPFRQRQDDRLHVVANDFVSHHRSAP
jgi:hypothetical protein